MSPPAPLPKPFRDWFTSRGWVPHPHQQAMLDAARAGQSALLVAPTGAGKTLSGFLPSLVSLSENGHGRGLHTLYISPLKALSVDVHRNLMTPMMEMGLPFTCETRTGDTNAAKKRRQRHAPPDILLTTPESLSLLLSYPDSHELFQALSCVIVDELHALEGTKRGDLLSLCLARLRTMRPGCRQVGLSATVHDTKRLAAWIAPGDADIARVRIVQGAPGPKPELRILVTENHMPWSGHMAVHAMEEIYQAIRQAETTLVFVNTRAQAEIVFNELWRRNEEALPIALHHGSLSAEQRRKVEAAMAKGTLRGVVATSSLDLGIDWGAIDLVVQVGAPKGSSRLIQRIGRANHRYDEPSNALLVPANRFEFLECLAAQEAVLEGALDGDLEKPGGLDVLSQHILALACARPFQADELYAEVTSAAPYRGLERSDFDDVLAFVATGGYALGAYDRFKRLVEHNGAYGIASPSVARHFRLNAGVIVEAPVMKVRLGRGKVLGEVEEYFVNGLRQGDAFIFAGQLLRFEGIRENQVIASRASGGEPRVPAYVGGRFPMTTHLAERVRALLSDRNRWRELPDAVRQWLRLQQWRSVMPPRDGLLIETFPRGGKEYLVAYCFEGRQAHQTLGMLLTRRLERFGCEPLGFVATDYVLATWSLRQPDDVDALFDVDMLGDDLEAWMAESSMLRRTFRNVAVIAGLIDRRNPGREKTGRQVSFNADLIYDVLRRHEPDHVLLRATRRDAATGLTDVARLSAMLERIQGRIVHRALDRVSPLAVPVMLEVGKENVYGTAVDSLLDEAAAELIAEATAGADAPELPFC